MSHSVVTVPNTDWVEPVIIWLSVAMPTGAGKSWLYKLLVRIVNDVRKKCHISEKDAPWMMDEVSLEKLGDMMASNSGCLLGLYDELTTFLSQVNIYPPKGIVTSHELATMLSLYNGNSWSRQTGTSY